ncbi:haloacid dehalogenase [Selenomonas sp. oral taxon 920]|uniref:Cof-type HAD-IIB family hydrolase n=1 Tax=Selenomonas sp. oral taxon 920 TaxID=1884263 RepID=UPI000840A2F5|nr:Cof-type HAD-IIB family hydrolase [Selenomonas sp. oral taxon 920]AOH47304.1 haloacid dehalogenase [Selenomonas sp. oral taxon 920]
MAVKLFVSDLDGTMLPDGNVVSAENIAAVRRAAEAGVTVTIATGRMFEAALPVAEALGVDVPIISYNGGLIKSPSGCVYEEHTVDPALAHDLIAFCKERGWYIQSYSGGVLRYVEPCDESRFYENSQKLTGEAVGWDGLFAHTSGNCKLVLVTKELSVTLTRAEAVLAAFGERVDVMRSANHLIEIVPKGISKASALKSLAGKLGIAIEETMAIGDAYNDLPMLKAAGKSVAMGNAFPEVKEVTDYETLSCEENGLAAAIYHYVLGMGADAPVPMTRG